MKNNCIGTKYSTLCFLQMEQAEYQSECINWENIEFQDNQEILDLIGMKSVNVMSLIDEESKFPKGTDLTLLEKLHVQHGNRSIYIKPKSTQTSLFGIRHYAGVVLYNPYGFLEKNRDSFSMDMREILANSTNKYLVDIFPMEQANDTMKKQLTLSVKFRNSLELLMRTLSAAHPFFIRCIKPNEEKKPKVSDFKQTFYREFSTKCIYINYEELIFILMFKKLLSFKNFRKLGFIKCILSKYDGKIANTFY